MKREQFRSGVFKQQYQNKSFSPIPVNQVWTWEEPKVNTLLEKAIQALSGLNAFSLLTKDLENAGILKEMTGFKRNRLFIFEKYLSLF